MSYARTAAYYRDRWNNPEIHVRRKAAKEKWMAKTGYKERLCREGWRRLGYPEPTRPKPERCEACGDLPGKKALNLDHCHVTNAFRGWLCGNCNTGIGKLGDNEEGLLQALAYLRRNAVGA